MEEVLSLSNFYYYLSISLPVFCTYMYMVYIDIMGFSLWIAFTYNKIRPRFSIINFLHIQDITDIYIYILNIIYKYFNISFISFSICNRDSLEHEFCLARSSQHYLFSLSFISSICILRIAISFNDSYPSVFHIKPLSARTNKNHWSHLPRCNLQNVIRNYATWSAPAIPPSRAPINSPAAAPACRCAFKVNRVSRYAPLSWSHARFIQRFSHRATLRKLAAAVHGHPHVFLGVSTTSEKREARNDTFKVIRTRVPAIAQPGSTKRLRRTGAAPALRV